MQALASLGGTLMARSQSEADGRYASLEGNVPLLVTPGSYDLRFDYYETSILFGKAAKLTLWFTVIEVGHEQFGQGRLPRYFNIVKPIGRRGRDGRFKVGPKSDFIREYARLFGAPARLDRIPMSEFERHIIRGKVRTVMHGSDQRPIPEGLRYSVIDELVEVLQ